MCGEEGWEGGGLRRHQGGGGGGGVTGVGGMDGWQQAALSEVGLGELVEGE